MSALPIILYCVFAFVMAIIIARAMNEKEVFPVVVIFVFAPLATFLYVMYLMYKLIKLAITYKK